MYNLLKNLDKALLGGSLWRRKRERRNRESEAAVSDGLAFKYSVHYQKNRSDPLAELCDKYGSDKGEIKSSGHPYQWPSHNYTDYYSRLFSHCRTHIQRVFECGLGTNNPALPSSMGESGKPGASLRAWRDYFPSAIIYGGDIDRGILFQEERIRTSYIDQLNTNAIADFWAWAGVENFDLMIDDGLHSFEAGSNLFSNSFQYLSPTGIYVIEDFSIEDILRFKAFFRDSEFCVEYVTLFRPNSKLGSNNLVVIRR
jgi:hypothetical protein